LFAAASDLASSNVHHSRGDLILPDSKSSIRKTFSARATGAAAPSGFLGAGPPSAPAGAIIKQIKQEPMINLFILQTSYLNSNIPQTLGSL
jgi:hypothetical protein